MHRYTYDADNRLEAVFTSSDGYIWDEDARYLYYAHGPMARVELGEYKVQGMDYYYTLQGWIKGVNLQGDHDAEATNNVQKYVSKDAFGYALHYYQNDYQSINGNFGWNASNTTDLFNGNIAAMSTTLKTAGENVMLYNYDQLNRIKTAVSSQNTYQTGYSYDANGNILSLLRNDHNNATIDNLSYTYNTTQNNRLQSVNDVSNNDEGLESGSHSYTYDEIGNLSSDKDIESIQWTVYGKIAKVKKRDLTEIEYKYDGTGQRIYKKVATTTVTEETHYVRDGSGNVLAIYENKVIDELVIYGSSRLGSYNGKTDQGKRTLGNKKYELSNHLGNVLSVISDNKIGIGSNGVADYYEPLVISESDYYPFGMAMKERSFSNEEYRFGFNTQEKTPEIGEDTYTAEFWQYDSKIARRWNNDPKPNTSISVYAAFAGNPILLSDHLGDTTRYYNSSGEKIGQINDELENAVTIITDDNLAAFTRDYKFFKSLNDDLQKNSNNYFAYALRGDGISYMTEGFMYQLRNAEEIAKSRGERYIDNDDLFFFKSDVYKRFDMKKRTAPPKLSELLAAGLTPFQLPFERAGHTYINEHNEVRVYSEGTVIGSNFNSVNFDGEVCHLSNKIVWTRFHIHPVPAQHVGVSSYQYKVGDDFVNAEHRFTGAYTASGADMTSPGTPRSGKFNVISNWEKGGTLIFHANEGFKYFKVHLYE